MVFFLPLAWNWVTSMSSPFCSIGWELCTVELPCATPSRKRPPPISNHRRKTPKFGPVKALQRESLVNNHLSQATATTFGDDDFIIFHMSRPPLAKDLLWFDSCVRPPPVSDTMSSHFAVVAYYGRFDCTEYFSSKAPTHHAQRPIEYLPSRWWLGGA